MKYNSFLLVYLIAQPHTEPGHVPVKLLKGYILVAKFIVPDWGDKVDSGIGYPHQPARLHRLAGRNDNPMLESSQAL
jgi:hypothetical protein